MSRARNMNPDRGGQEMRKLGQQYVTSRASPNAEYARKMLDLANSKTNRTSKRKITSRTTARKQGYRG